MPDGEGVFDPEVFDEQVFDVGEGDTLSFPGGVGTASDSGRTLRLESALHKLNRT